MQMTGRAATLPPAADYPAVLKSDERPSTPEIEARPLKMSVYDAREWYRLEPVWREIEENSPYSSFYLTTEWVAAWLEVFGKLFQPQLLVFEAGDVPVGICLLVKRWERRGPFRIRRIYLNCGGEDLEDRTLMEFNNVLCRRGWEDKVSEAMGLHLSALEWDEFAIEGISPGPMLSALESKTFRNFRARISIQPTFYVDLEQLRLLNVEYENTLSCNTRQQLRRSLRLYAKLGELRTEIATDISTAEKFFQELCELHQSRWMKRGETGAFAPGLRLDFHRALIARAFSKGTVQMLRVSAGTETIGVLYNFVRNGKVYFFQSGFRYDEPKQLKPGLVTHALAIRHCLQAGFKEYDFLAGDARYKRSLARSCRAMAWVVFPKPHMKLALISTLRVVKRHAANLVRHVASFV
jgi:hypothetical protein